MMFNILTLDLQREQDTVAARQRARQIAAFLGFDTQDQTRISTAVSEIVRNAYQYSGGGKAEFSINAEGIQTFTVCISDRGAGIPHLKEIFGGRYTSSTGMGIGLMGAKRLMDVFKIDSMPGNGTTVVLGKHFPKKAVPFDTKRLNSLLDELSRNTPDSPFQEIQKQNQELLRTLDELKIKQSELGELNRELEDTNRGVLALYAELDEKAESLKRANETKTSFLANMTHEFRTPVNSVLNLSRLLLDRIDGPLTSDQEKQVSFIQRAARDLSDLVNDLLDLAKVEAGKIAVRTADFDLIEMFGGLRGILKPLISANSNVSLIFDESQNVRLHTDEGKLAQILRNLISNALKYTESGEVRVSARTSSNDFLVISVSDTGIGIDAINHAKIFEDFSQIDSDLQNRVKGTGLGLPLSRKLAQLLGGTVTVSSEIGKGSVFSVVLPIRYKGLSEASYVGAPSEIPRVPKGNSETKRILLIDDDEISRYLLKGLLVELLPASTYVVLEASSGQEGIERIANARPSVIFLDLSMPVINGFEVLETLKSDPKTASIPVIINSSTRVGVAEYRRLSQAVATISKESVSRGDAIKQVRDALEKAGVLFDSEPKGIANV